MMQTWCSAMALLDPAYQEVCSFTVLPHVWCAMVLIALKVRHDTCQSLYRRSKTQTLHGASAAASCTGARVPPTVLKRHKGRLVTPDR